MDRDIVDIALRLSVDDSEVKAALEDSAKVIKKSYKEMTSEAEKNFASVEERVRQIKAAADAVSDAMTRADKSRGKSKSSPIALDIKSEQAKLDMLVENIRGMYTNISSLEKQFVNPDFIGETNKLLADEESNQERLAQIENRRLEINRELHSLSSKISKNTELQKQMNEGIYTGKFSSEDLAKRASAFNETKSALLSERELLKEEAESIKLGNDEIYRRLELLDKMQNSESAREAASQGAIDKQLTIGDEINKQVDSIEDINKNIAEMVSESGLLSTNADNITDSVQRAASATKEVMSAEQVAAKESLKGARNRASANYYVLRSLKMTIKEIDNIIGKMMSFEKVSVSALGNISKAILRMGIGFKGFNRNMHSATKSHQGFVGSLKHGFMTILKYSLGIRSFYFLVNKLRRVLVDSMGSLATASDHVNHQMSAIASNLSWMKGMVAVIAQPFLNILVPAMDLVAKAFERAASAVASFFAVLTGQSFIYKAIKPTEDWAASLDKAGKSAKKAKDNLQSFDKLNVLKSDKGSGGGEAGQLFEQADVEPAVSRLAETVKKIAKTLFSPIKKAWKSQGEFVMNSWKSALHEISTLTKVVGKDFLDVWANDRGVQIWTDILHIVGDVGSVVANLANNFSDAWQELGVGKRIFEELQTLIGIVVNGIKAGADATVAWSEALNFSPLLDAVYNLLVALEKPIQTITNLLTKFWTDVILPFRGYIIETGLPKLLDTLREISNAINWDLLEERMNSLIKAFEPFLEKVWEAFLIVVKDLGQKLADLVNSDGFGYLVDKITEFMQNASPEEMAKAIENIAKAIVFLHAALVLLNGSLKASELLRTLYNLKLQGQVLDNLKNFNKVSGVTNSIFKTLAQNIAGSYTSMTEVGSEVISLKTKFNALGTAIKTGLIDTLGPVKVIGLGIVALVAGITIAVKSFISMFKNGFSWIKETLMTIGIIIAAIGAVILGAPAVVAAIVAGIVAVVATIVVVVKEHWEEIKAVLSTVGTWIYDNVISPVVNIIKYIGSVLRSFWIVIKAVIVVAAKMIYDKMVAPVIGFFSQMWATIKTGFSTLMSWIKPILLTVARFVYVKVIQPIKSIFDKLWDGITSGIKGAINACLSAIEGFLNFIIDSINGFTSGLSKVASAASKITGDRYDGILQIQHVSLPRLAQGAVIPPNKEFMAILGDQKHGTNIEAPLDTIKEAVAEAFGEQMVSLLSQQLAVLQDIEDKDIVVSENNLFKTVRNKARMYEKSTGVNAFSF